jgi:hypothetical protein
MRSVSRIHNLLTLRLAVISARIAAARCVSTTFPACVRQQDTPIASLHLSNPAPLQNRQTILHEVDIAQYE